MKILVVGASGFIGKNLIVSLAGRNEEVVATYMSADDFPRFVSTLQSGIKAWRCDLRDEKSVIGLFEEFGSFDKCVYLACDTRVGYLSSNQPEDVINNILPMANFVKHYKGGPVVFFSSGAVYSGQRGLVSNKDISPSIPYAISKLAAELYLKHQSRAKSFGHIIVRFFGAYGPHEPERKITRKLLMALKSPSDVVEFVVYGDGNNLIDVMYVDDVVNSIIRILESEKINLTVDLCAGHPITVNNYVEQVFSMFGKTPRIIHKGSVAEYIEFWASNQTFVETFGYLPKVSLAEGLLKYKAWLDRIYVTK
jgi:nucleoside-diphosphate-sugar epimerase